jgi:hypothetical protein
MKERRKRKRKSIFREPYGVTTTGIRLGWMEEIIATVPVVSPAEMLTPHTSIVVPMSRY